MSVAHLFTDHPASVGESYLGHMAFALSFATLLAAAAMAALIHAVFPFLCQTTASRIVRRLADRTAHRGHSHQSADA